MFLYFRKWNPALFSLISKTNRKIHLKKISYTPEISYIFLKDSFFLFWNRKTPKKNPYISGKGTFLYFAKGIFRTLTYLEIEANSEPFYYQNPDIFRTKSIFRTLTQYMQNPRHIQNTVKHLRWNLLALILRNFLYSLRRKFFLYFGKQYLMFQETELSYISGENLQILKSKR